MTCETWIRKRLCCERQMAERVLRPQPPVSHHFTVRADCALRKQVYQTRCHAALVSSRGIRAVRNHRVCHAHENTQLGYGWVVDCGVHRRHVRPRRDCPSPCRHCIRRTHAPRQWQHILQYCVVLCSKNGHLETLRCRHATLCQQSGRLGAIHERLHAGAA